MCPLESRQKLACAREIIKSGEDRILPNLGGAQVDYCLSKRMPKTCRLEYASLATALTVAANGVKLLCFIATYVMLKWKAKGPDKSKMQPIITTGDTIASFLASEDTETLGMSIVEKEDFHNGIWDHRWIVISPRIWRERSKCCRFRAIGVRR